MYGKIKVLRLDIVGGDIQIFKLIKQIFLIYCCVYREILKCLNISF
jgi:hypothetical protein